MFIPYSRVISFHATFRFWFFCFFIFFRFNLFIFRPKVERICAYGCFFHSFWATDLNFGTPNSGRMKYVINFKVPDFCKLLRLCAISASQVSKKHFACLIFCTNKACVNCGTLNAKTQICLLWGTYVLQKV